MSEKKGYATSEEKWVFRMLMVVAGFYGGYAMLIRGGVFSNAQTGNVVLCALALGEGNWRRAAYFIIPISAYMLGCFLSELFKSPMRRRWVMRWETVLILIEIVAVAVMGFIPATAPHQICQILINLICAMRLTTFQRSEGVAMATIFCTNHIRNIGTTLASMLRREKKTGENLHRIALHSIMILCFMVGVAVSVLACRWIGVKAIWCVLPLLAILFAELFLADRKEKANI